MENNKRANSGFINYSKPNFDTLFNRRVERYFQGSISELLKLSHSVTLNFENPLDTFISDKRAKISSTARITPFIVIPSHYFNHPILHNHS